MRKIFLMFVVAALFAMVAGTSSAYTVNYLEPDSVTYWEGTSYYYSPASYLWHQYPTRYYSVDYTIPGGDMDEVDSIFVYTDVCQGCHSLTWYAWDAPDEEWFSPVDDYGSVIYGTGAAYWMTEVEPNNWDYDPSGFSAVAKVSFKDSFNQNRLTVLTVID